MLNFFKVFLLINLFVIGSSSELIDNDEQTLILLKPDAVERKLVGKIIERFENKGFKLVGLKMILASRQMVEEHYSQHINRSFFEEIVTFMTSGPIVAMIWKGPMVIKIARNMMGNYLPHLSEPGTIRGDYSLDIMHNVIHGADSAASADREINIWFQNNEVIANPII